MKLISISAAIILFSFVISGCGSNPKYRNNTAAQSKQTVVTAAKKMLGVNYLYGGTSPNRGFDCSGLVQYSHRLAGINVPRTTSQQYRAAKRISKRYLKAGDLVFFKTTPSRGISHVGIYLGNNKFIHAPSSGKQVKISSMNSKYWRKRFISAGRIL